MHISTKSGSGIVCGKQCSIIITEFVNKDLIIISDCGKIGILIEISFDKDAANMSCTVNAKTLFGIDQPEAEAVAQGIVETLQMKKPVVFGFSMKEFNYQTAADLRKLVSETLKKECT